MIFFTIKQLNNLSDLLAHLNSAQQEAVRTTDGPVLIMAGAGSGKTRALTYRIAYLIKEKKVPAEQILAVTFTNKAAEEMKRRLRELTGIDFDRSAWRGFVQNVPMVGTFHSIGVKFLRQEIDKLGRKNDFVIYDSLDTQSLMKKILKDFGVDEKKFHYKIVLNAISAAKNELIDATTYPEYADNFFKKNIAGWYTEYQKRLKNNNAVDFDDLLMIPVQIWNKFSEVLKYYQEKWRYILVDEYQDTNYAQYVLINLLARKYRNLCVIGDSDQSIYSFRGADIRNILNFEQDYPEAKIIKLEQNYRSTQIILDAADQVIAHNPNRPPKKMWTNRQKGANVKIMRAADEREEGVLIVNEIKHILKEQAGTFNDYSQFVILYRTNAQSRMLEEALLYQAIPYKVIGGVKFYARREIKDVLAYLRFIQNKKDTVSWLRIINVPARKIGLKTIAVITKNAQELNITGGEVLFKINELEGIGQPAKTSILNLVDKIEEISTKNFSVSDIIHYILENIGYKEYLLAGGEEEGQIRLENVLELISVARKYDGLDQAEGLTRFLEEVALIADVDGYDNKDNAVTLMTLHTVKGLEFPYVFIAGCEENIFPHARSLFAEDQLAEERRLMYVGMTRAEERLFLLYASRRMIYGDYQCNSISRFLLDISNELTDSEILFPAERLADQEFEYEFNQDRAF
jgi:DNA helicase-2/ATP-dependent DNA helicase PcrA